LILCCTLLQLVSVPFFDIIVYNLPEQSNRAADKVKFIEVCKSIGDDKIDIEKLFRLGRKTDNKHRPLLVGFSSENDKQSLLAVARSSNEFKKVYIVTDMTKLERERHKKVVAELKRRRSSGESNLIIRNGVIVSRHNHSTETM